MMGVEKMEDTSRKDSAAKMGNAQISPVEAQEAVSDLLVRFDALKAAGGGLAPNFQAFVVNATAAFERLRSGRPLSRRERRQMKDRAADNRVADNLRASTFAIDPETIIGGAGCMGKRAGAVIIDDPQADIGRRTAPLLTLDVQADTVAMRRVDYVDLVRELTTLRAQVKDLTARAATAGIKASEQRTYTDEERARAHVALDRQTDSLGFRLKSWQASGLVDTVAEALGLRRLYA